MLDEKSLLSIPIWIRKIKERKDREQLVSNPHLWLFNSTKCIQRQLEAIAATRLPRPAVRLQPVGNGRSRSQAAGITPNKERGVAHHDVRKVGNNAAKLHKDASFCCVKAQTHSELRNVVSVSPGKKYKSILNLSCGRGRSRLLGQLLHVESMKARAPENDKPVRRKLLLLHPPKHILVASPVRPRPVAKKVNKIRKKEIMARNVERSFLNSGETTDERLDKAPAFKVDVFPRKVLARSFILG